MCVESIGRWMPSWTNGWVDWWLEKSTERDSYSRVRELERQRDSGIER